MNLVNLYMFIKHFIVIIYSVLNIIFFTIININKLLLMLLIYNSICFIIVINSIYNVLAKN